MSEVLDHPVLVEKEELKTEPPKRYSVTVLGNSRVCRGKISQTLSEVFEIPFGVAVELSGAVKTGQLVTVASGLTAEVAEMKAAKAMKYFNELMESTGCGCGSKAKFSARQE